VDGKKKLWIKKGRRYWREKKKGVLNTFKGVGKFFVREIERESNNLGQKKEK